MSISVGYNDWAQIDTLDADLDVAENAVAHPNGSFSGNILNCQNWPTVAVAVKVSAGGTVAYSAAWFADQNGTQQVGLRAFNLDSAAAAFSTAFLPNQGPYVGISGSQSGLLTFTHSFYQWMSRRQLPYTWQPHDVFLQQQAAVSINAGATLTVYNAYIWGGPIQFRWVTGTAAGTVAVQVLNDLGNYVAASDTITIAASSSGRFQLILPEAQVRVQVTNSGAAAATFAWSMWPSVTGSS